MGSNKRVWVRCWQQPVSSRAMEQLACSRQQCSDACAGCSKKCAVKQSGDSRGYTLFPPSSPFPYRPHHQPSPPTSSVDVFSPMKHLISVSLECECDKPEARRAQQHNKAERLNLPRIIPSPTARLPHELCGESCAPVRCGALRSCFRLLLPISFPLPTSYILLPTWYFLLTSLPTSHLLLATHARPTPCLTFTACYPHLAD